MVSIFGVYPKGQISVLIATSLSACVASPRSFTNSIVLSEAVAREKVRAYGLAAFL